MIEEVQFDGQPGYAWAFSGERDFLLQGWCKTRERAEFNMQRAGEVYRNGTEYKAWENRRRNALRGAAARKVV